MRKQPRPSVIPNPTSRHTEQIRDLAGVKKTIANLTRA
jgi:hypothetical protein